jgi:hypothetical protein
VSGYEPIFVVNLNWRLMKLAVVLNTITSPFDSYMTFFSNWNIPV